MHARQIGCLALAAVLAVPPSIIAGFLLGELPARDPIDIADARAAMAREEAHATALGLTLVPERSRTVATRGTVEPVEIALSGGECVAVVAAAWGHQQIHSVFIARASDGEKLVEDEPSQSLAAHAQWCTDSVGTFRLGAVVTGRDFYERGVDGFAEMRVYRGWAAPFGGLAKLRRGDITLAGARSLAPSTFAAQVTRDHPRTWPRVGPDLTVPRNAALLIPEDATTYRRLHVHARNGTTANVAPRVEPLSQLVPPAWRPLGQPGSPSPLAAIRARVTTDPPAGPHFPFLEGDGARRVLAVIDHARLGARCHHVELVRMLFGRRTQVQIHRPLVASIEMSSRDNVAHATACADQGIATYSVPATDGEAHLLRLYVVTP